MLLKEIASVSHNPTYAVLHRVLCSRLEENLEQTLDIDPPVATNEDHLRSHNRVTDLRRYYAQNKSLSFIVIREYMCCPWRTRSLEKVPEHQTEQLIILSESLLQSLLRIRAANPGSILDYVIFEKHQELQEAPVWTYYSRTMIEDALQKAESGNFEDAANLRLFLEYFRDSKRAHHAELESLLKERKISVKFAPYLFVPGACLARCDTRGPSFDSGSKQTTWASFIYDWTRSTANKQEDPDTSLCFFRISIRTMAWKFDGEFYKEAIEEDFMHVFREDELESIADFKFCPVEYMDDDRLELLMSRGRMFWKCRKKQYIQYTGLDDHGSKHPEGTRFMIDGEARRDFSLRKSDHGDLDEPKERLPVIEFDCETPPPANFLALLPRYIEGYHMQEKQWMWLLVSNVRDVVWNYDVFNTLVLPNETKELIKALVINKIETNKRTDFFHGKGSGLVILFHGPPGTGKTLTAESVAELANKPLYRVACGDIGTKPDEVEKHLKRALWLAEQWNSVVLLDEAEVFLQERTLDNVERNALVSIFLRTLEYYNGSLILTTNRVGIFDEGFRSRIQLAIHYEELSSSSREQVWENFIKRLEGFQSENINTRDLRDHLKELGEYKMNGRQIRNAVTTARQLAMYKKKPLDFERMQHVIKVTGQFDKYLLKINEGMDSEALAREDGLR